MVLRADRDTENTNTAFLQSFLQDHGVDIFAKEKSFMYIWTFKYLSLLEFEVCHQIDFLQHIEVWWGHLHKNTGLTVFKVGLKYKQFLKIILIRYICRL